MRRDHGLDLFRIVYVSRASLPVLARFDATVSEILAEADANNRRLGVTSLLAVHSGWFMQALEGPRRNVSIVFGAILRDMRHAQVEVLEAKPVDGRLFGDRGMQAVCVTSANAPELAAIDLAADFDPFQIDAEATLRLMSLLSEAQLKKAG